MNQELLKRLQLQAGGSHYPDINPQIQQKFAELIVAECMEVFSKDLPDPTSSDYQLGTLNEVVNRVCAVAEHFGVKS